MPSQSGVRRGDGVQEFLESAMVGRNIEKKRKVCSGWISNRRIKLLVDTNINIKKPIVRPNILLREFNRQNFICFLHSNFNH